MDSNAEIGVSDGYVTVKTVFGFWNRIFHMAKPCTFHNSFQFKKFKKSQNIRIHNIDSMDVMHNIRTCHGMGVALPARYSMAFCVS